MNNSIKDIKNNIEKLISLYERILTRPLRPGIDLIVQRNPWVFDYLNSMKNMNNDLNISMTSSVRSKQSFKSNLIRNLIELKNSIFHYFAMAHSHTKIPSWIQKNRNGTLIEFFEIFFEKIKSLDEKTLLAFSINTNKWIIDYFNDFKLLNSMDKKSNSKNDLIKMKALYSSLLWNLRLFWFSEKKIYEELRREYTKNIKI